MFMQPLEDMPLLQRIVVLLIIVAVVLFFLMIASWYSSSAQNLRLTLPPSKWDRKMLELDKEALDIAYKNKVAQLFNIWVTSGLETDEGAVKGHAQAQRAFIWSQQRIELREQELEERERQK